MVSAVGDQLFKLLALRFHERRFEHNEHSIAQHLDGGQVFTLAHKGADGRGLTAGGGKLGHGFSLQGPRGLRRDDGAHGLKVFRRIHAVCAPPCQSHAQRYAVFQKTQLLQFFQLLQRRGGQRRNAFQHIASKGVQPHMPRKTRRQRRVPRKRNGRAGKIQGIARFVHDHLDLVRRGYKRGIGGVGRVQRRGQGARAHLPVRERRRKLVQHGRFQQRLIPLNVDDNRVHRQIQTHGGLPHAVRAAGVIGRGRHAGHIQFSGRGDHAFVVRGQPYAVQRRATPSALPDMSEHGTPADVRQRFARQARRGVTRGYDAVAGKRAHAVSPGFASSSMKEARKKERTPPAPSCALDAAGF